MRVFATPADLAACVGERLGESPWTTLAQSAIDAFAAVTGDAQWIHVDAARAARELPGGRTLAHGFLLLALLPRLERTIWRIERRARALNYGLNRVRFVSPVPSESALRLVQTLAAAERTADAYRFTLDCTLELAGAARPAVVAQTMCVVYPQGQ